jgi:hypothetical protein
VKSANFFLKAATVASSVLLVTAFVGYRAGAFDWLLGRNTRDPMIMGGSKSKILVDPAVLIPAGSDDVQADPAFMSSSKSIIFVPPPKTKGTQPPASP